jgi:multiple sugar transport system permease protein
MMVLGRRFSWFGFAKALFLAVSAAFALLPIVWGLSTALKTPQEIAAIPPSWIPHEATLMNFHRGVFTPRFLNYILNTVYVIFFSTLITLGLAAHAAYAAVRFRFAGKRLMLLTMWSTIMIPAVAIIVPLYHLSVACGIYNTHLVLVLVYSAWLIPSLIWLLEGFVAAIPRDLEEAAYIDGCGVAGAFYRITCPLLRPGLVAGALLIFTNIWNEFILSYVLILSDEKRLVQVGIYNFMTDSSIEWGPLMATAVGAIVPILVVYAFLQRSFVQGLTGGIVK